MHITRLALLFLALAFTSAPVDAQAGVPGHAVKQNEEASTAAPAEQAPGQEVSPKPGEMCLVCDQPIGAEDITYMVNGQRIPVHRIACDAKLRANLAHHLAQLQPRGAFLGAGPKARVLSRLWFFVGLYVLLGLLFAALCAHRAMHAGRRPAFWFVTGLVFLAVGYFVLFVLPKRAVDAPGGVPGGMRKVAATYAPLPCPNCGGTNHPSATRCLGCGGLLEPRVVSEVARVAARTR